MFSRPTFRNLADSFESWAYRNGFSRALAELERRRLIESQTSEGAGDRSAGRLRRITEAGRLHALGGRDPEACWRRPWDGRWHLVLYDLPATEGAARNRLRNVIRSHGFGWLQNSVWISPHPLPDKGNLLAGTLVDVESLLFMTARPSAGETDQEIVAGAWDFADINRLYARHMAILATRRKTRLRDGIAAGALRRWTRRERLAWLEAASADPLLPERLLPKGYLGQEAWRRRVNTLHETAVQMRAWPVQAANRHERSTR
jgi:phenylacetic acid degradation operon negative regulatory protein